MPVIDGPVVKLAKTKDDASTAPFNKQRNDPSRKSGYEETRDCELDMDEITEDTATRKDLVLSNHKPLSIDWGLDHVDPQSRFCLGYCKLPRH